MSRRRVSFLSCMTLFVAMFGAGPAKAVESCLFNPGSATVTVTMSTAGDSGTLRRDGNAIEWDAVACGAATVNNTNTITVAGSDGAQGVTIDLGGGQFAPGKTAAGDASSPKKEIEISVALNLGSDSIEIVGSPSGDRIRLGSVGINLNNDDDRDVTVSGVEAWFVEGRSGNDQIRASGGRGTGSTLRAALVLYGDSGADVLVGGPREDYLGGGPGGDSLVGGAEDDDLEGDGGPDSLAGGSGDDDLIPGEGNDKAAGGPGDDTLEQSPASEGSDVFSGGPGEDDYDGRDRLGPQNIDTDGRADDGLTLFGGEGDNVKPDVERIFGGEGDDKITGNGARNNLSGEEGNDELRGGAGDDSLTGRAGDDLLIGGDGEDSLNGNDDNDVLRGGNEDDTVVGDMGDDEMFGDADDDSFFEGGPFSENGTDVLHGGSGEDDQVHLFGRTAGVLIYTDGVANDGYFLGDELDNYHSDIENLNGTDFGDTLSTVFNSAPNILNGAGGNDNLYGGSGADRLSGAAGNDNLYPADGMDFAYGGVDNDTFHSNDNGHDYLYGEDGASDNCADRDTYDAVFTCEILT